jgi:hypothetical protein
MIDSDRAVSLRFNRRIDSLCVIQEEVKSLMEIGNTKSRTIALCIAIILSLSYLDSIRPLATLVKVLKVYREFYQDAIDD